VIGIDRPLGRERPLWIVMRVLDMGIHRSRSAISLGLLRDNKRKRAAAGTPFFI
jgi:hypothetical protein